MLAGVVCRAAASGRFHARQATARVTGAVASGAGGVGAACGAAGAVRSVVTVRIRNTTRVSYRRVRQGAVPVGVPTYILPAHAAAGAALAPPCARAMPAADSCVRGLLGGRACAWAQAVKTFNKRTRREGIESSIQKNRVRA